MIVYFKKKTKREKPQNKSYDKSFKTIILVILPFIFCGRKNLKNKPETRILGAISKWQSRDWVKTQENSCVRALVEVVQTDSPLDFPSTSSNMDAMSAFPKPYLGKNYLKS